MSQEILKLVEKSSLKEEKDVPKFAVGDSVAVHTRILEGEKAEFHWDARVQERYLGQHLPADLGEEVGGEELARIAILSFLAGRWHAGICLVDGNGCATDLLWLRSYEAHDDASETFARVR